MMNHFSSRSHTRGLFIIDNKGIVRSIIINDIPVGRSVDEVLRLVKAYQFTDIHGDVCPEGWQPGKEAASTDHMTIMWCVQLIKLYLPLSHRSPSSSLKDQ